MAIYLWPLPMALSEWMAKKIRIRSNTGYYIYVKCLHDPWIGGVKKKKKKLKKKDKNW